MLLLLTQQLTEQKKMLEEHNKKLDDQILKLEKQEQEIQKLKELTPNSHNHQPLMHQNFDMRAARNLFDENVSQVQDRSNRRYDKVDNIEPRNNDPYIQEQDTYDARIDNGNMQYTLQSVF